MSEQLLMMNSTILPIADKKVNSHAIQPVKIARKHKTTNEIHTIPVTHFYSKKS